MPIVRRRMSIAFRRLSAAGDRGLSLNDRIHLARHSYPSAGDQRPFCAEWHLSPHDGYEWPHNGPLSSADRPASSNDRHRSPHDRHESPRDAYLPVHEKYLSASDSYPSPNNSCGSATHRCQSANGGSTPCHPGWLLAAGANNTARQTLSARKGATRQSLGESPDQTGGGTLRTPRFTDGEALEIHPLKAGSLVVA